MFSTSLLTWLNRRSKFCLKVRLLLSVASANEAKMVVAEQNLKKFGVVFFSRRGKFCLANETGCMSRRSKSRQNLKSKI